MLAHSPNAFLAKCSPRPLAQHGPPQDRNVSAPFDCKSSTLSRRTLPNQARHGHSYDVENYDDWNEAFWRRERGLDELYTRDGERILAQVRTLIHQETA